MQNSKAQLTIEDQYLEDQKVQSAFLYLYLLNVLTYSIAIVLISYQEYSTISQNLPYQYTSMLYYWTLPPIASIDSNYSFQRLPSYTFHDNYSLVPYCPNGQKLCGGMDQSTKLCVKDNVCPMTDLQLTAPSFSFYYTCNNNTLCTSTYASKMPYIDIKILNETLSKSVNYSLYELIDQPQLLYGLRYPYFDISCRTTILPRLNHSVSDYHRMVSMLFVQTIYTLAYCAAIGVALNVLHFLITHNYFQMTYEEILQFRRFTLVFRILAFIPYVIIICIMYFYQAQMLNTLQRVNDMNCVQDPFINVISSTISQVNKFDQYQVIVFSLVLYALAIETISVLIVTYRSTSYKKKNLERQKYEQEIERMYDKNFNHKIERRSLALNRGSLNPQQKARMSQTRVSVKYDDVPEIQNRQPVQKFQTPANQQNRRFEFNED